MEQRRRPLLDSLVLLDAYVWSQIDDYDGSELQQRVARAIEIGNRRNRIRHILPLPGQLSLFARCQRKQSA